MNYENPFSRVARTSEELDVQAMTFHSHEKRYPIQRDVVSVDGSELMLFTTKTDDGKTYVGARFDSAFLGYVESDRPDKMKRDAERFVKDMIREGKPIVDLVFEGLGDFAHDIAY